MVAHPGNSADSGEEGGSGAFSLEIPVEPGVPVLIAVPHAGRDYPAELTARMRHPEFAKLRLEDRYVDLVAREIARLTSASLLIAHSPRAILDLNRSPEDVDWHMIADGVPGQTPSSAANRRSRSGLGLVPRRLPGLGEIWRGRITQAELDGRIDAIHRPYHRTLSQHLAALRDRWGAALLLDLHSMPPLGNRSRGEAAAEFVIGDRFGASCDPMLSSKALGYFSAQERLVAHNRPYSGGYVLERHGMPTRGIHAIQIEICRTSYLDSQLDEPSARVTGLGRLLSGLVRTLAEEVAQRGRGDVAMAAE